MSSLQLGLEFCLDYDDLLLTVQLLAVTRDRFYYV